MQLSNTAFDFAQESGDDTLSAYVLMRKSNIATDAHRSDLALRLARTALVDHEKLSPRLRAVVLRQLAHAQLQAGDAVSCARSLETAFKLAERTPDSPTDLAHYCTPEYLEMEAAHCWVELGRAHDAVTTLQQGLAEWQPEYRRDLGLCLARLSVAHATGSQADHAVYVADRALSIANETRSFRIAAQLARVPALLTTAGADEQARTMNTKIALLKARRET